MTPDHVYSGIQRGDIDRIWPVAWPMLERSINVLAPSIRPSEADILATLKSGKRQLWLVLERVSGETVGAVVTEIVNFPDDPDGIKVCHIFAAGGRDYKTYITAGLRVLGAWGKAHGCVMVAHGGRRGWQRIAGTVEIGRVDGKHPVYGLPIV